MRYYYEYTYYYFYPRRSSGTERVSDSLKIKHENGRDRTQGQRVWTLESVALITRLCCLFCHIDYWGLGTRPQIPGLQVWHKKENDLISIRLCGNTLCTKITPQCWISRRQSQNQVQLWNPTGQHRSGPAGRECKWPWAKSGEEARLLLLWPLTSQKDPPGSPSNPPG